jgi:predicted nucleic acid-binding protein
LRIVADASVVAKSPQVLATACRLAIELRQHVFDTLYHAVALESGDAILLTADERYARAAATRGRLMRLREWPAA